MILAQARNKKLASFIFNNTGSNSNLILETRNDTVHIKLDMKKLKSNSIILFIPDAVNEEDLTITLGSETFPVYYQDEQAKPGSIWEDEIFGVYYHEDKVNLLYFTTTPNDITILAKTYKFI